MNILPESFYQRGDVVQISRDLLGKYLYADIDGEVTGGKIVETEAYAHVGDRACHSHLNRRTTRTEVMYQPGGVAYVYKVYGFHYLFNLITNVAEKPDAVLVRAIEPTVGIETMLRRRDLPQASPRLTAGPGMLTQAMGIHKGHYGLPLTTGDTIWLIDEGETVPDANVIASPRVGIAYAGEDAALPWRFRIRDNPWTSKAK